MRRFSSRRAALILVGLVAVIAYLSVERTGDDVPAEVTSTPSARTGAGGSPGGEAADGAGADGAGADGAGADGEVVFGEAEIDVGGVALRVQVADTLDERAQGLMHRESLDPYDGMLFVFESDTQARFTMSNTPLPLTIGFYDRSGARVATRAMTPCDSAPERCPTYSADATYRFALEVPRGSLPSGRLDIGSFTSS